MRTVTRTVRDGFQVERDDLTDIDQSRGGAAVTVLVGKARVTATKRMGWNGEWDAAEVNWSAMGAVGAEFAREYGLAIALAATIGAELDAEFAE